MKLLVENYEAIEKVVLDLPPGSISVINGSNGNGKTSLIRAIDSFIRNRVGTSFIRFGTTSLKVGFKNEDSSVIWDRSLKETSYVVNGKREGKLNKKSLPELFPNCGFLIEKDTSGNVIPNIINERTKVFPFNVSPATTFRIFNRFLGDSKLSDLLASQKESLKTLNKEHTTASNLVEVLDKEIQTQSKKLSEYGDVELAIKCKNELTLLNLRLAELKRVDDYVSEAIVKYTENISTTKKLLPLLELNKFIGLKKDIDRLINLKSNDSKVERLILSRNETLSRIDKLKPLGSINLKDIEAEIKKLSKLKEIMQSIVSYERLGDKIKNLVKERDSYKLQLSSFDSCPLCGQTLPKEENS